MHPFNRAVRSTIVAAMIATGTAAYAQDVPADYQSVLTTLGKTGDFKNGINARLGLNTWAAFSGTDADAMVAGDVAMLENEVTPVLKSLRANGINIVAIHHHMTGVQPAVIFLHYYGTGPAAKLAQGVRGAVDLLGKTSASQR